jgi:dTDP-4-amino-4,6-dideoxygalactose transaminase
MPAKMEEIMAIANKYDIIVIEDSAEALGSYQNKIPCGTFGDFGILSFNGNKIITTSSGGALVSNDINLINKSRFLATQARDPAPHYQHSNIGYNYRMSNVLAAIGVGQLDLLESHVNLREAKKSSWNFISTRV